MLNSIRRREIIILFIIVIIILARIPESRVGKNYIDVRSDRAPYGLLELKMRTNMSAKERK